MNEFPKSGTVHAESRPKIFVLLNLVDRGDADLPNPTAGIRIDPPAALRIAPPKDRSHFTVQPPIIASIVATEDLIGEALPPKMDAVFKQRRGIVAGQQKQMPKVEIGRAHV